MAENAEIGSRMSFTTRSSKNLSTSGNLAEDAELVAIVIDVMIKRSKNHLFPRNQMYLHGILAPNAAKKDEFPLTVVAMLKALS